MKYARLLLLAGLVLVASPAWGADSELSVLQEIRDNAVIWQGRADFLLRSISITLAIMWGMYSWRLILIAKSQKEFW